jgi:hypothetical protein
MTKKHNEEDIDSILKMLGYIIKYLKLKERYNKTIDTDYITQEGLETNILSILKRLKKHSVTNIKKIYTNQKIRKKHFKRLEKEK